LSIAEHARRRIFREHTPDHRARQLETYYLEAAERRVSLRRGKTAGEILQTADMQMSRQ
jgi:hypothetical protein